MLFIGVGMVASVSERHEWLLRIHKLLGIAILMLALARLGVRLLHAPSALPPELPALQKVAAHASHCCMLSRSRSRWSAGRCCPRAGIL